jgi:hypothetical protein
VRYLCIPAAAGRRQLKEAAAIVVNNLVQSFFLGCFVFLGYRPSLIAIRPAAGVEGNGRERKRKRELRSWNLIDQWREDAHFVNGEKESW